MRSSERFVDPDASVLFVCMGNICRSPTAEGVFRTVADRAGLAARVRAASAGSGTARRSPPDRRAIQAARRRGYDLTALRARQVETGDFARFGWILAMDRANLKALEAMRPHDFGGHLGLLLDFAPELGTREVPDPYYGGPAGFEHVLDLVEAASAALLVRLQTALRAPVMRSTASRRLR
jgi:protein-tyrosine phosphatase